MASKSKVYLVSDFGYGEVNGEQVTAVTEFAGKFYVSTANRTYVLRKPRWYQRLWRRVLDKLGR